MLALFKAGKIVFSIEGGHNGMTQLGLQLRASSLGDMTSATCNICVLTKATGILFL